MTTPAEPTRDGRGSGPTTDGVPAAVAAPLEGIVVPTSLGEAVFERLRDAIIDKSLPPGSRIAEWAIAQQLGVSRTPVRETLWRLRQMGLIEAVGRKGYQVAYPSRTAIEQAYEVHEALQVLAAGVAVERGSDEELAAIRDAALASLAGATNGDMDEFLRWDDEFHERITRAAQNSRLKLVIDDTAALVLTLRARDFLYQKASVECGRAHVAIGEAMLRRDRPESERQMRAHIQQVRDYVLEADSERQDGVVPEPAR
jgi:GntR family transcriptional regulator, rspAB operon transcriptional repressor